jgi:PAS domain S-box-containing protein
LRDRETRLQAILNTAVDAIITIDERGLIESLNTEAVQLFGYSPEEAIGGNVGMLMPSPYGDEHDDYLDRYRETGQRRIIGIGREVVGRHKDGTVFPIELTVSEVILGTRRLFTGIVRDISFRKQAEEQLQLLGTALGVLNEGVVITEAALDFPGPRILFVNEAMTRITGYTRDELLSKTPRIFQGVKTDRAVMQRLKQELSAGRPFVGETVNYRKDGREFFVQLQIVPVFDDSGCVTNYVSTHRDVTELRAAQHRLLQSERLAAIGKAMTGLAHESRNALQRSQASLEMLARRIDDRPEAVDLVARIQRAQDDLHRLYEEVREYAAPTRFHPKMTNVAEILHEAWEHLDVQRNERQACLTETYGDRPVAEADDLSCEVDRFALRQVFRNILENAFAACDDPVEIGVQYASIASTDKPMMRISIRDNGPGLTAEAATRIFEEFFTTKTHGTGLGMAICRRFIEAHSGRIEVGEETGPGTEIIITLPRRQS